MSLFRLTVKAEGPGPPACIRLRTFLKGLLRRAGLRCVSIEELPPEDRGAGEGGADVPHSRSGAEGAKP